MSTWTRCPSYEMDLDLPEPERFAVIERYMIDRARRLLEAIRQHIPGKALSLAPLLNARTRWRFSAELKAMGRYTGIDWRWLMLGNVSYDLALASLGCSTVVMPTPEGPMVARNMDWWPQELLAAASCTLRFVRGGELLFAIAGWPGSVGAVTGLSARGFAVVLNAVLGQESARRSGYPVLLFLRRVLEEADGFEAAVKMIHDKTLFTCGLITVAGTTNHQRVCIERTPTRAMLRWPEPDEPLVATNSYLLMDQPPRRKPLDRDGRELFATTCTRYERLDTLARELLARGNVTPQCLLYALTDPEVIQEITAQHVVVQPGRGEIDLYVPTRLLEQWHPDEAEEDANLTLQPGADPPRRD